MNVFGAFKKKLSLLEKKETSPTTDELRDLVNAFNNFGTENERFQRKHFPSQHMQKTQLLFSLRYLMANTLFLDKLKQENNWNETIIDLEKLSEIISTPELSWFRWIAMMHSVDHQPTLSAAQVEKWIELQQELPESHQRPTALCIAQATKKCTELINRATFMKVIDCLNEGPDVYSQHTYNVISRAHLLPIGIGDDTHIQCGDLRKKSDAFRISIECGAPLSTNYPMEIAMDCGLLQGPTSLQRFFCQVAQINPVLQFDVPGLTESQSQQFNDRFLELAEKEELSNSHKNCGNFHQWKLSDLKRILHRSAHHALGYPAPSNWLEGDMFKMIAEKRQYLHQINALISGFNPHHAIALFLHCLQSSLDHPDISHFDKDPLDTAINGLKVCLQISLTTEQILQRPPEEHLPQLQLLAHQIFEYAKTNTVIIPVQIQNPIGTQNFNHMICVTLRINDTIASLTYSNGGDFREHHHRNTQLAHAEHPSFHYLTLQNDNCLEMQHEIESHIVTLLHARASELHSVSDYEKLGQGIYGRENPAFNTYRHSGTYLAQSEFGNCSTQNLKSALTEAFFSDRHLDIGFLIGPVLLGIATLAATLPWEDDPHLDIVPYFDQAPESALSKYNKDRKKEVSDDPTKAQMDHIIPQDLLVDFSDTVTWLNSTSLLKKSKKEIKRIMQCLNIKSFTPDTFRANLIDMDNNMVPGPKDRGRDAGNQFDPHLLFNGEVCHYSDLSEHLFNCDQAMSALVQLCSGSVKECDEIDSDHIDIVDTTIAGYLATISTAIEEMCRQTEPHYSQPLWETGVKRRPAEYLKEMPNIGEKNVPENIEDITIEHSFPIPVLDIEKVKKGSRKRHSKVTVLKSSTVTVTVNLCIPENTLKHIYERHYLETFKGEFKEINTFWKEDPYTFFRSETGQKLVKEELECILRRNAKLYECLCDIPETRKEYGEVFNLFGNHSEGVGKNVFFYLNDPLIQFDEDTKKYEITLEAQTIAPQHPDIAYAY